MRFLTQTFMKYIIYNPGLKKIPIGQQHIHNKYWKNDVLNWLYEIKST